MFCDGVCNTWLHRGCAGLSKPAFKKIAASNDPFYCPHCSLAQHKNEIDALKAVIEKLSSDLLSINSKFNIIVHGIHERPQGTPHHIRLKGDFEDINSVLQNLNLNSQTQPCVRDCRRIGKYDVSKPRPRPIIDTLNSTIEVSSILARRRFVTVIIKADLTPASIKLSQYFSEKGVN